METRGKYLTHASQIVPEEVPEIQSVIVSSPMTTDNAFFSRKFDIKLKVVHCQKRSLSA